MEIEFALLFADWLKDNYPDITYEISDVNANGNRLVRINRVMVGTISYDKNVFKSIQNFSGYGTVLDAADPEFFDKFKSWLDAELPFIELLNHIRVPREDLARTDGVPVDPDVT